MIAFMIVRAIGAKVIPVERITIRDARSYCSVFVDDNNRKPICRLYFNSKNTRGVGIFNSDKVETRHQIVALSDLYKFAREIEEAVSAYA